MKILVTIPNGDVKSTFIPPYLAKELESLGEVVWNNTQTQFTNEELREKIKDVDLIVSGWQTKKLDAKILENANKLKLVAHTGGSVGYIVEGSYFENGRRIISGNLIYAESVAEGVLAYILCAQREIIHFANEVQAGRWRTELYDTKGLLDQTIGLVGFGTITKFFIKLLAPFRVNKKIYSGYIKEEDLKTYGLERATLKEIFQTCSIISLHSSLRPDTHHMIGKELLEMIPNNALLVNTARGAIIDEKALEVELQKKRFRAILDVYEEEPLPASSKLRGLENVILIPHMAGPTIDRRSKVTEALINDIRSFFNGGEMKFEISKSEAAHMTQG